MPSLGTPLVSPGQSQEDHTPWRDPTLIDTEKLPYAAILGLSQVTTHHYLRKCRRPGRLRAVALLNNLKGGFGLALSGEQKALWKTSSISAPR